MGGESVKFTLKYVQSLYKKMNLSLTELKAQPGFSQWAGFDDQGEFRFCPMCVYWMIHINKPIPKRFEEIENDMYLALGKEYVCGFGNGWDRRKRTCKLEEYERGYQDGVYCRVWLKPKKIINKNK
jgi:hypothetical protein